MYLCALPVFICLPALSVCICICICLLAPSVCICVPPPPPRPAHPPQLHRIVISRQSPDALLGLPGVLCVIGASREKGHEKADIPVHVFGPEGTCEFLNTMYDVSESVSMNMNMDTSRDDT